MTPRPVPPQHDEDAVMKYAIFGALALFSFAALADHSPEHTNAQNIDLNSGNIESNRLSILSNNEQDERLSAGIALSNSLGSHQYDFDHDGVQASFGVGGYEGEFGASFGFAIKPSENTLLNMQGGRTDEGDGGASMSLNIKF